MNNSKTPKEPTEKQKLGRIGEDIACQWLADKGYKIVDRNYLKKWGEIDIVAKKGSILHFVEVKSVSRDLSYVIRETNDSYRAEDNLHEWKLKRLGRAIQSYLLDKNVSDETDWQFDVITVKIDQKNNTWIVSVLEDLVL